MTDTYNAAHTGTQMFAANLIITIKPEQSLSQLREEFLLFCDDLNLDATIEPFKG